MIRAALTAHAVASRRAWSHDRSQSVGASEIGQCARKTWFSKNEDDPVVARRRDENYIEGWGATTRGTIYENAWWEPALRAHFGDALLFAGAEQRTFSSEFLTATPDGLIIDLPTDALAHLGVPDIRSDCILVECKSIDPRVKLDGPKPEHVYQAQAQLGLVRERTNYKPEFSVISYTDTSFWDEVREFPIRFDAEVYAEAKRRAAKIMSATSASDLRPEGIIAGSKECEYCPFASACGVVRATDVPAGTGTISSDKAQFLAHMARRAKELKAEADELTSRSREIEHDIRRSMSEAGTKRFVGNGVSITWSAVKGRPSWDMKGLRAAAEAAGIDLAQFETTGDPSDRLTITIKESGATAPDSAADAASESE